jgi:prepilin-type N-terminal cleavage/methylation domain-containing protein/prepilin-type processing-associated H-X9-DG protein
MRKFPQNFETCSDWPAREGFTLIELLTVVAIICILAALLFPAAASVMETTRKTRCVANERNLGAGCLLYAADNSGLLPNPNWGAGSSGWLFNGRANARMGVPFNPTAMAVAGLKRYPSGQIWPYVRDTSSYWCPDDRPTPTQWNAREDQLSTYVMNGAVGGYGLDGGYANGASRLASFRGEGILLWESYDGPNSPFNDGSDLPNENVTGRHKGSLNVVCFDGHVESMALDDYVAESLKTPGRLWCNPVQSSGK